MNKRLTKILSKAQNTYDSAMIDLYNQSIREDISCTILTNMIQQITTLLWKR